MENYLLFVVMCILLILMPGPDFAVVTKNTLSMDKAGGLKTASGTCCALLIHTTAAILGLSALIVKSALLFSIFKYAGAVYLIYLGVKTFWSLGNETAQEAESRKEHPFSGRSCFQQGFFTNLLNPKVALFFLTFFPQFVNANESTLIPFFIMGIAYAILTALWFTVYILLIHRFGEWMKHNRTQKIIESITGVMLIGFGLKLALEQANE